MEKDWIFAGEGYSCDVRVAAVLVKDHKILVQRERNGMEYALPGGHIKIGETLEEGLIREFREEMAVNIRCRRVIWSEECFWQSGGRQVHNISFYFLVDLCDGFDIPDDAVFVPNRDNDNVVAGWLPVGQLEKAVIYPEFLKKEINCLDGPMKHFVTRA